MTWHSFTVLPAIAIVSFAILELPGFDFRFHHRGQAWQFTCTQGVLHLGNAPQLKLEAERSEAARDARTRINDARETPLREILRHEAWRSQAYQVALIKLNQLRDVEADETLRAIAIENALRPPAIEHSVQMSRLILPAIAILAVWLAIQSFSWTRRLRHAGWTRRQLVASGVTSLSALLFFALAYLWMRSNYVVDELFDSSHQRQGAEYGLTLFSAEGGNFYVHHYEEAYLNPKLYKEAIERSQSGVRSRTLSRRNGLNYQSSWIAPQRSGGLPFWRQLRFAFTSGSSSQPRLTPQPWAWPTTMWIGVTIPIWPFMLPFALGPILWLRKMRRHIFTGPNRCPGCGYDLRASPERCPECGMVKVA